MFNPHVTRVSIALATYNAGPFLSAQLASFVGQTRLPDELVVSDDGSDDGTLQRLEAFSKRSPFPVAIRRHVHPLGPSQNFGQAIARCTGDLILLSDQDDVWLPTKVERIVATFRPDPTLLVAVHDLALVDAQLRPSGITQLERMAQLRMPSAGHVTGSATAFRASVVPILLPIPDRAPHDTWVHLIGRALEARTIINEVLTLYRRHSATDTSAAVASWTLTRLLSAVRTSLRRPTDVADGSRLAYLTELQNRLASQSLLHLPVREGITPNTVASFVDGQRTAVVYREAVLTSPWILRWRRVAVAHRHGAYREFAGPASLIRDLIPSRRTSSNSVRQTLPPRY